MRNDVRCLSNPLWPYSCLSFFPGAVSLFVKWERTFFMCLSCSSLLEG